MMPRHRRLVAQARLDSPLGPITVAATEQGLAGLWFDGQAHHPGPLDAPVDAQQRFIALARAEAWRPWRAYAVMGLWHSLEMAWTPPTR